MLFLHEVRGMRNGRTLGYFNEFVLGNWSILTFRCSTTRFFLESNHTVIYGMIYIYIYYISDAVVKLKKNYWIPWKQNTAIGNVGKKEITNRINRPTWGCLYNRDCYLHTKGRDFSFHLAACKLSRQFAGHPLSLLSSLQNVAQLKLTNSKAASMWRR